MKNKGKLTVHSIVCNEPYVYYAIKSVYPYVDKILLYDTGSYDRYTLSDIETLLKEDLEHKIVFKQVSIDVLEADVDYEKIEEEFKRFKGKKGKGSARQLQIDDTDTDFFMVVDGDEIYYRSAMEKIRDIVIPTFPSNMICGFAPLIWYSDITERVFHRPWHMGRIFRTNAISILNHPPDEMHVNKYTGELIKSCDNTSFKMDIKPFIHYSDYVKPWRRSLRDFKMKMTSYHDLPEVMLENTLYWKRFIMEKDFKELRRGIIHGNPRVG